MPRSQYPSVECTRSPVEQWKEHNKSWFWDSKRPYEWINQHHSRRQGMLRYASPKGGNSRGETEREFRIREKLGSRVTYRPCHPSSTLYNRSSAEVSGKPLSKVSYLGLESEKRLTVYHRRCEAAGTTGGQKSDAAVVITRQSCLFS